MADATPAAAAAGGAPAEKEKKKARPGPPPPSAAIMTASVAVRGALAAVLGQKLGGVCGPLQVVMSEPGTAKVTMSFKGCSREAEIMAGSVADHEAILRQVEGAANEAIAAGRPLALLSFADGDACAASLGDAASDEALSGKAAAKTKDKKPKEGEAAAGEEAPAAAAQAVEVAYCAGFGVATLAYGGSVCGTLAGCGQACFDYDAKKGSAIDKGKKQSVSVKFTVAVPDAAAGATAAECGPGVRADVASLNQCAVTHAPTLAAMASAEAARAAAKAASDAAASEAIAAAKTTTAAAAAAIEAGGAAAEKEMVVDPWTVEGKIDYDKLVMQFGSKLIDAGLLARIERLTVGAGRVPCLHPFLRRGIFFSHRDLSAICDAAEARTPGGPAPFYLYTGRGPSSASMHLGHLVPFMMTQWLQKAFDVPLVIQMTDDEKFLWKGAYTEGEGDDLMRFAALTVENAKDIIACGFDKEKTFIFSDLDYMGHMYPNVVRIWKAVTYSQAKGCFGFEGHSNIGQSAFPAIQAAPSFPSSFPVPLGNSPLLPCLIPCAIDQDPYFRITRDIAHKLVPAAHPLKGKPSLIHSKFFPPLEGALGKMSSSNENSAIFLTDTHAAIAEKIKTHAFSGGQETKALQELKGADLEVDVAYQWLSFFLDDDAELAAIAASYSTGKGPFWSTGLVKDRLIRLLQEMVSAHQAKRAVVDDAVVKEWMAVRRLA